MTSPLTPAQTLLSSDWLSRVLQGEEWAELVVLVMQPVKSEFLDVPGVSEAGFRLVRRAQKLLLHEPASLLAC